MDGKITGIFFGTYARIVFSDWQRATRRALCVNATMTGLFNKRHIYLRQTEGV